jgi:hypothetical protein
MGVRIAVLAPLAALVPLMAQLPPRVFSPWYAESLRDRAKRVHHALWLIEHHPDSEILHSPLSRFTHEELTAADYRRAVVMWNAAAKSAAS